MAAMNRIPDALWAAPVQGTNLRGRTLGDELGETPTLFVFVRHLG
jgi:hypothetical protein